MSFNPSIGKRVVVTLSILILLVLTAVGTALVYSHLTERNIKGIRRSEAMSSEVSALRVKWLHVIAAMDHMLITRQSNLAEYQLYERVNSFQNELKLFIAKSGPFPSGYDEARERLNFQSLELDEIIDTFRKAGHAGDWPTAQLVRHVSLASLQRRLDDDLNYCTRQIDNHVNALMAESLERQDHLLTTVIGVSVIAILMAIGAGGLAILHISRPINELTKTAQAIRDGNLSRRSHVTGHGEVGELAEVFNSMTDRLSTALTKLGESEERFHQLADAGWEAIVIHDNGLVLQVNKQFTELFGLKPHEIEGKMGYPIFIAPESLDIVRGRVAEGNTGPYEAVGIKSSGERIDMEIRVKDLDYQGRPVRMAAIRDITSKKRAERELANTRALFQAVVEQSPIPIAVASYPDMILRVVNPACQRQLGIEGEPSLVGQPLLQMKQTWKDYDIDGNLIPVNRLPLARALNGEVSNREEIKAVHKDGTERWHYVSGAPIYNAEGDLIAGHIVFPDITERKKTENELLSLRNYLENIVNSMPSMLVGVDPDGVITQWNKAAQEATGLTFEEAEGRPLSDALPELAVEVERIREAIRNRQPWEDSKRIRVVDGEVHYEDVTIFPLIANGVSGAVIRVDDITPRVRIEEMMIQTEKMMSVGGLAAGMAHEINNPLGIVLASTKNITKRLSPQGKKNREIAEECGLDLEALTIYLEKRGIADNFNWIQQAGERAAHIVSNMLEFSRKSDEVKEPSSVNSLLETTVELVFNDFSLRDVYDFSRIEFIREYDESLPKIPLFRVEIEQVLLNLLKNAIQALAGMGDAKRDPRITLRTGQKRGFVFVEIEDNGPGMDKEIRKRVFEPFFTTKEIGIGTGLGLSVSFFIVTQNHGGKFHVDSEPDKGARFTIMLPVEKTSTEKA